MAQLDLLSMIPSGNVLPPTEIFPEHYIAMEIPRKSATAYKTISEVSEEIDVPQHVLRFWESHFPQVKPSRMRGARRYYRPEDVDMLKRIKVLLYQQGYTIKGAKKVVKSKGGMHAAMEKPATQAALKVAAQAKTPAKKKASPELKSLASELRSLKSMLAGLV
jgi:DNA-binding transcriptional MerR regulator